MDMFSRLQYCFLFVLCILIWRCRALPEKDYSPYHSNKLQEQHISMIQEVVDESYISKALVRSYKRSFNGFAASLTKQEQQKLASFGDVVSIFPSRTLWPQTTRSWDFLGLHEDVNQHSNTASDIVIGVLDSGIWPESESFSDQGFGPIPRKWKGVCNGGSNFTCNKHRQRRGPSARIAAYKVCHSGCKEADILAAFDDAIADGVDIITISLGSFMAMEMRYDSISIGSLHAMQKGILTVHSAEITVLRPRQSAGKSVNAFKMNGTEFPLVYGKDVTSNCSEISARLCYPGCLNSSLVSGKIVLCDEIKGIEEALNAGASGTIAKTGKTSDVSFVVPMPASALLTNNLKLVQDYINSTKEAKAFISTSETTKNIDAPLVASFSSKGPNPIIADILKPDITAPGVEILAAYSPVAPVSSNYISDERSVKYNVLSGTSMSAPHAAGAAAYVKSVHPDWSPSAIKSAIMTTETVQNLFKDNSIDCSKLKQVEVTDLNYPSMAIEVKKGVPLSASFSRTVTNVGLANSTYTATIDKSTSDCNITVEPATLSFKQMNERNRSLSLLKGIK
ncbi:hypothetical protein DH2020_026981 [Rehmannia glutinosa]|uniref:Uncharacterized protein n=1 Tax=Rehmannia glutinosa TaxID=99300 RepID=A0ABR0VY73_REHGL